MSTLKTNNLQHLDSGSANIELAIGGGAIHSGISTFNKVRVGSATTFTDELVVNGDARITGILTIGTGSITLDPNNDEIKLGETKLKRESSGEIKITDLQGNLKGLKGKKFKIQVPANEKNKNGIEVGTGATITSPNDNELAFRTNDEPRVKIDSNGKVGIGLTNPAYLLDVKTTGNEIGRFETTSTADLAIELKNAQGSMFFGLGGGEEFAVASTSNLNGVSDNLFCIKQDGKVGIDSITPNATLEINVANGGTGFRIRNSSEHDNKFQVYARSSGDTDYHTVAYVHKNNYPLNHFTYAGTSYNYGSVHAGRTRSNAASPTNYYRHGAHIFDAYSGCTDDSSAYRSRAYMRAWDGGDDGDRNAIYYVNSGSDTTTVDLDQHQKFGVKANGAAQFGHSVFAGRVESDEGTPNSVYVTGERGFNAYANDATDETYIVARNVADNSFIFYSEVNGEPNVEIEADGDARTDGTWSNANADYAEMFEWADGNANSDERRGMTVVLDGDKIKLATDSDNKDNIIGVVSANPVIVGDSASLGWHGRYKKDSFDAPVRKQQEFLVWNKEYHMEDGVKTLSPQPDPTNPKTLAKCSRCKIEDIDIMKAAGLIPDFAIENNIRYTDYGKEIDTENYDPTKTYIPRMDRKEWDAIGLIGKLVVKRGQPVGSRWILMKSNVGVDPNDNSIILDRYLVR
jgi:hypothetical protein